jgi:putative protein-disulfide isomerase
MPKAASATFPINHKTKFDWHTMTPLPPTPHLLYIADPMCSWCYGFAPVIGAIAAHFGDRLPVHVMVGGLRAGNTKAMAQADKDYISSAWTRVNAATGQPFDHAFFARDGFVYDTEPACRAIVAVRALDTDKALSMKAAISTAFYGHNRDTTSGDVLADIAAALGVDRAAFVANFHSADIRNETLRDFLTAKDMGVEGFPCLVVGSGEKFSMVTSGYRPVDGMIEALEKWLAAQTGSTGMSGASR